MCQLLLLKPRLLPRTFPIQIFRTGVIAFQSPQTSANGFYTESSNKLLTQNILYLHISLAHSRLAVSKVFIAISSLQISSKKLKHTRNPQNLSPISKFAVWIALSLRSLEPKQIWVRSQLWQTGALIKAQKSLHWKPPRRLFKAKRAYIIFGSFEKSLQTQGVMEK